MLPCVCAVWQFAAPPFGSALQGYRQQAQIYSALVERAQAAGVTNSIPSWTPSVVRGYWNCKAAKTDVQALLAADYWVFKGVEPATWIAGTNDFIRVGLTNDDLLTNLLDVAQLPTNFFTSTPLFGLSVSSNGWCGFTQALPQLVWTRSVPAITYTNEQKLAAVMDFGETPVYRAHTNDLWEMWSYDDYSGTNFYASSNALLASVGSLVATNADDFYYLTNAPTGRIGSGWERMVHQVKLDMSGYNHYDYIFDVGGDWTEYIEQAEPRT
ncbi:MAG: hypothetical protein NTY53_23455, partial [Kiritimatiellaeota bacterium]|nr:hypothetical protein [Kiritimatiellota bacterium]